MKCRALLAGAALLAVAACGSEPVERSPETLATIGAARAFAAAVVDTAAEQTSDVRSSEAVTETFEHLLERRALAPDARVGFADTDTDGIVDGGQITFMTDGIVVCLTLPDGHDTAAHVAADACAHQNETVLTVSRRPPATDPHAAPAASDGTAAPTTRPDSVVQSARDEIDALADMANIYSADHFARQIPIVARAFGDVDPASVEVISAIAAGSQELHPTYSDADGDGIVDGRSVNLVANGTAACVKIPPVADPIAVFGACR